MKITIEFPQIMKMVMGTTIDVPNSATLQEIKDKVFESFWKTFAYHFPNLTKKHGTSAAITIKDRDIEITSDDDLKERLKTSTHFQAVFKQHSSQ